jgi:hypothetical protein
MTEYILNETLYATDFVSTAGCCWGNIFTFDFKITTSGNVHVMQGIASYNDPQPIPRTELFSIIDNISIPEHIIDLFKYLMKTHCVTPNLKGNVACRMEKTQMFFDIVKNLKKSLGNITKNSVETPAELQAKIEYYINKNTTITKGLERANEKIKNMKEQYDCVVKQNEELKKENTELFERLQKFEQEKIKQTLSAIRERKEIQQLSKSYQARKEIQQLSKSYQARKEIQQIPKKVIRNNNTGFLNYVSRPSLSDCWSNPGGASICTAANASNLMVYNELSGIYEPSENL